MRASEVSGPQACSTCAKYVEHYTMTVDIKTNQVETFECDPCKYEQLFDAWRKDRCLNSALTMAATLTWLTVSGAHQVTDNREAAYLKRFRANAWKDIEASAEVWFTLDRLREHAKHFEREVWYTGLQKQVDDSKWTWLRSTRKYTSRAGVEYHVVTTVMAGRQQITLGTHEYEVNLLTEEGARMGPTEWSRNRKPNEGPMGLGSVIGTEEQVRDLLQSATEQLKHEPPVMEKMPG